MKNILAVFNCVLKVMHPEEDWTEDDRYFMISRQDLFAALEEAEQYISDVFNEVYGKINNTEWPYKLVNDEYDIYIKILNDKFESTGYEPDSVDMLTFDHDIRSNDEYLKYVDYVEYRYDFKTRKSKRYENVYGCEPIRRDIGDSKKYPSFKIGDIVKLQYSDKLYVVSGAPTINSLNRTVWNLTYCILPYICGKETDLFVDGEKEGVHESELELVSKGNHKHLHLDYKKGTYIITDKDVIDTV